MASLQSLSDSGQFHSTTAQLELPTQKCCRDPMKKRYAALRSYPFVGYRRSSIGPPSKREVNAVFSGLDRTDRLSKEDNTCLRTDAGTELRMGRRIGNTVISAEQRKSKRDTKKAATTSSEKVIARARALTLDDFGGRSDAPGG